MIIYQSRNDILSQKTDKYQASANIKTIRSKSVKVNTSPKEKSNTRKKQKLTKKNIKYLKTLGLKIKVSTN